MHEFMARFNKDLHQIPNASRCNEENQKGFFLNAMPPDFAFPLKRENPTILGAAQTLTIEVEDDLIISSKWKKYVQVPNSQASTSSSSNDSLIQKLANDLIVVKKQLPKASFPYQDIQ